MLKVIFGTPSYKQPQHAIKGLQASLQSLSFSLLQSFFGSCFLLQVVFFEQQLLLFLEAAFWIGATSTIIHCVERNNTIQASMETRSFIYSQDKYFECFFIMIFRSGSCLNFFLLKSIDCK